MGNWQWLLDLVVAVLLAATLLRAYRLDRALTALRRDRGALEVLTADFDSSARQARGGIENLRELTDGAARRIDQQTKTALALKDDLVLLVERGEQTAERLDHALRAIRALPQGTAAPRMEVPRTVPPPAPVLARPSSSPAGFGSGGASEQGRVRSKAERDLLMALQAGR